MALRAPSLYNEPMPQTTMSIPMNVRISISEPAHLCRVQTATRGFCRSIGMDESAVFEAVIAVTELAHRLFIERSRSGDLELVAVPDKRGLGLEIRAENAVVQFAGKAGRVTGDLPWTKNLF